MKNGSVASNSALKRLSRLEETSRKRGKWISDILSLGGIQVGIPLRIFLKTKTQTNVCDETERGNSI